MAWAGYGILVNGCEYYAGTKVDDFDGYQQYLAHVTIASGDYCELYDLANQAAWVVPLDGASVAGFEVNGGTISCTTSGCFDFYIKLKYQSDQLYVGAGSGCGDPQNLCPTTGFYVAGNGVADNPWCCGLEWDPAGCPMGDENSITFENVPAGKYAFKVTNGTWEKHWGGVSVDAAASTKGYATDNDGNVVFSIAESANITISCDGKKIVLVSTVPFQQVYVSAVPSQCPDVLLQGFYYDSYEVNSAHAGTELYGDTKWKTLLAQSGEIGAYFDLIWLPPSSYASGTGYHPKQYSNQNSDWGSRADLTKLIKAFHNAGTKVVADIVINHTEAMASWCDFAVQNFGEYGTFQPDGSYICSNDEINWDTPDIKKAAGECWGTATGNADDGENWEGARDWSHDMPKVQEMFKAYLKWMRNEIGYDGWRYDKGDGFHNWHMDNYNKASEPYIAFMEYYSSNSAIKNGIANANNNVMAFDFQTRWRTFRDGFAAGNYMNCRQSGISDWGENDIGLIASNMSKYAITFIENHDMFMRDDNDNEFCGRGNSMKPENKGKLMRANAYLLSMPGVPCVFYPHWAKYKEDLKPMIDARHLAGVHSESELTDEEVSATGYKVSVHGTNGILILTMGDKTITEATGTNDWLNTYNYKKVASGDGYAIWVTHTNEVAPGLMVTPSADFQDSEKGIEVTMQAVGGSGEAKIYYTTDGTDPTTTSEVYTSPLTFKQTTTLKVMAACGEAQTAVQTYTYTYREPLKHGITVYFNKPAEWEKVYFYAWAPGKDEQGNPTAENIMGDYPGQRIYQDAKGWYSYEFDQSMDSVNFCISSGEDCGALNVRSNDLVVDYDTYYAWEEGHEAESKYEKELEEEIPLNPEFDLVISPETGNFRDLAEGQKVTLSVVGRKGATIYYSTDGSDPGTCANPATDSVSFVVNQTCTVQAYAFDLASKEFTDTVAETYTYKAPQQGAMTVKFFKPKDWKNVYLYAFTRVKVGTKFKDTAFPLNGEKKNAVWPGMKWTTFETKMNEQTGELDSIYSFTMPEDIKEIYVIFNIGSNKTQTQDIHFTEDMCYVWNPDCRKAVENEDCTGYVPVPTELPFLETTEETFVNKFIMNNNLFIRVNNLIYDAFGNAIYKLKTINN